MLVHALWLSTHTVRTCSVCVRVCKMKYKWYCWQVRHSTVIRSKVKLCESTN